MPQFTTDRFLVRAIKPSDIHFIHKGLSNPRVVRYYGTSYSTVEDTKIQMDWYEQIVRESTGQWFAIMSLDDKTFYGAAGFCNWHKRYQRAEIGIWLLPDYWRRGIMREVFPPLCTWGYNAMNLFRIEATVEGGNENCIRAIERVYFTHEGTMRAAEIKHGNYIDLRIYSRLVMDETPPIIPKKRTFF
jgi:ribosomal-protein-alanine N-acetyltransferase